MGHTGFRRRFVPQRRGQVDIRPTHRASFIPTATRQQQGKKVGSHTRPFHFEGGDQIGDFMRLDKALPRVLGILLDAISGVFPIKQFPVGGAGKTWAESRKSAASS